MKNTAKQLELDGLLQMKKGIFLDWINKSRFFPEAPPFSSFPQLIDPRVLAKLLNIVIFSDFSIPDLDILLAEWRKDPFIPIPLFLENCRGEEILGNPDLFLLLIEFLYNLSFKNAKNPVKSRETRENVDRLSMESSKIAEKSMENTTKIARKNNESRIMEKSFENNAKLRGSSKETLDISHSTIGRINRENYELSPIKNSKTREKTQEREEDVSSSLKTKILNWLISIGLLRKDIPDLAVKLPKICSNGVIYADLIERIHGKTAGLRGVLRKTSNNSQIIANFNKVLGYFRGFEKLNPRFLFSEKALIAGTPVVFWGFLDDLYYFFNNKVSPNDLRYGQKPSRKPSNTDKSMSSPFRPEKKEEPPCFEKKREVSETSELCLDKRDLEGKSPCKSRESYRSIHLERKLKIQEVRRNSKVARNTSFYSILTPEKSRRNSFDFSSKSKSPQTRRVHSQVSISEDSRNEVRAWLKGLGFRGALIEREGVPLFEDPLRNGVLLINVLSLLGHEIQGSFSAKPSSITEIRSNWLLSFKVLKKTQLSTHVTRFFADLDQLIKGDSPLLWETLLFLKKWQKSEDFPHFSEYSESEYKTIEETLEKWLSGLLNARITMEYVLKGMRSGVFLSKLVRRITGSEALCFEAPKNPGESLMNINKSLEILKKRAKNLIGQRFLWKANEIREGNREVIIGLLEDLLRFSLGMPAREGDNYFGDGPITKEVLEGKTRGVEGKYCEDNKENIGDISQEKRVYSLLRNPGLKELGNGDWKNNRDVFKEIK